MRMSIDEPVIVTEYDPTWPKLFAAECNRIRIACGPMITRIEHFGSTAVPGMAAKPIVDLLVGVRSLDAFAPHVPQLERIGYQNFGAVMLVERLYLRRRGPPHFNIAVAVDGGSWWRAQLALRDYLRARPAEALAYANRKRELFREGVRTFESFTKEKAPYLRALLKRSTAWSQS